MDRIFVLSFKDNTVIARHTRYFLPKVEIKDYNDMTLLINLSAITQKCMKILEKLGLAKETITQLVYLFQRKLYVDDNTFK